MAVIEKDLGPVSAYAVAVAHGYTGTEAEWEALIANSAINAQSAGASATAAAASAQEAAQQKTQAQAQAVAAQAHATQASNFANTAGQANSYAQMASSNAAVSAANASNAQTAAEAAQAAAEAAVTGAEAAQTAAEAAVTDAQTAKTAAETAAATAAAAYGTDLLADDYSTSKTYAVGDYVIYSGNLYRCTTAITTAEAWTAAHWTQAQIGPDVSDLKSAFNDSDYILIGKENLINGITWEDNKYINGYGNVGSATNYRLSDKIPVDSGQTYTIIWTNTTGYYRVGAFTSDDEPNGFLINGSNGNRRLLTVTIPANTAYVRFSGYNNSITHGFIKGVSVETDLTSVQSNLSSLNKAENVVINAMNGIKFDTANKTITFVKPLYLTIGTQRFDYESTDTVISYASVAGSDVCLVFTNNALSCVARSAFDASTMVMVFGFNKNVLDNPSTNNIFYPYYVNGTLYNPPVQKRDAVYVDGINGLDTNDGTANYPYKTIQAGINQSPSIVYVKRGSYAETIDVNGKTDIQIVPWGTPAFSMDTFDVPMIVVNRVLCRNSQNVYFQDVHANNPGSGNASWVIVDVINGVFEHCWASEGEAGGFVATRLNGKFILCKAWDIGSATYYNSDGFNFHGYGTTELIDCIAHDCYDDGISHHDGCIASIKGGEFWNCTGGGGIAPVNRYCEIDGAYCHDNRYGVEAVQADASLYDPYILVKNSVLKNNTVKDISIGAIPFKVLRCTFDTKQIASGADYVEVN